MIYTIINKTISEIIRNSPKVVLFVCLFLYIYSIPLAILPGGIGSRMIFSFLGGLLITTKFLTRIKTNNEILVHRYVLTGGIFLLGIILISLVSLIINSTSDISLIKYSFSMILIIIAGYFISEMFKFFYGKITFEIISGYFILVVLVQVFLAVLMFFNETTRLSLFSLLNISEFDLMLSEKVEGFRLLGFGTAFFGAGIVNGYALMLIAANIRYRKYSRRQVIYSAIVFVVILSIGMMMARVTVVGGVLGLFILLYPSSVIIKTLNKKIVQFFIYLLLIPIVIVSILSLAPNETKIKIESAFDYGFEMFINYVNDGSLRTSSTDELKESYLFPEKLKTYFIGDGLFADPVSPEDSYYMGVDAGYLRLVYYFGIMGLLTYFLFQLMPILISIKKNDSGFSLFFIASYIYLLLLNIKGFADILPFSILFLFFEKKSAENEAIIQCPKTHTEIMSVG